MPAIGPGTRVLLAQPFLGRTARALEARGATVLDSLFPIGEEGTTAWLRVASDAFAVPGDRFDAVVEPGRRRAREAVAARRPLLAGQRVFLFPDSQLEPSIARFLHRELGVTLVEVGAPYLHRRHARAELALIASVSAEDASRTSSSWRGVIGNRWLRRILLVGIGVAVFRRQGTDRGFTDRRCWLDELFELSTGSAAHVEDLAG